MYCRWCGWGPNKNDDSFCRACGKPLVPATAQPVTTQVGVPFQAKKPFLRSGKGLVVVAVLAVIIIVVVAAVASYRPPTATTTPPNNPPPEDLTTKTADQIVLALADFNEAGWEAVGHPEYTSTKPAGYLANATSQFFKANTYGEGGVSITTTVLKFDHRVSAQAFYDSTLGTIKAQYSTESPSLGEKAFYYEQAGVVRPSLSNWYLIFGPSKDLYFLKKNVVVRMEVTIDASAYFQSQMVALGQKMDARI